MEKIQVTMKMKTTTHQLQNHGAEPSPGWQITAIITMMIDRELMRDLSHENRWIGIRTSIHVSFGARGDPNISILHEQIHIS
jgi:hypothetical protein